MVTPKPAIEGHFKTGQRPRPGLEVVVPRQGWVRQEVFDSESGVLIRGGCRLWNWTLARPGADQREAAMALPLSVFFDFPSKNGFILVFGFRFQT